MKIKLTPWEIAQIKKAIITKKHFYQSRHSMQAVKSCEVLLAKLDKIPTFSKITIEVKEP